MDTTSHPLRKIIVTGANKGIGFALVEALLCGKTPFDIILTSRDSAKGEEAIKILKAKHHSSRSTVRCQQLNITDSASIEHFSHWVKDELGTIDVLVNNAGILYKPETVMGMLDTLNTNFLGTVDLTERLLPYLTKDGKIIMVSSQLGKLRLQGTQIKQILEDPELSKEKLMEWSGKLYETCKEDKHTSLGFSHSMYNASKALLNAYTRWILVTKLTGDQQCYTMHPGWVRTDMGGPNATDSIEEGIQTQLYLINLPFKLNKELNGKYFFKSQIDEY